jgi:single-strand DNA-binding protein
VDDRSQKEKSTLFFDCSLWGKRGDALAQYLTKGSSVTVSGDLGTREYEGKTYLTVRVSDVTLQGGKSDGASSGGDLRGVASAINEMKDIPGVKSSTYDPLDDDVPF